MPTNCGPMFFLKHLLKPSIHKSNGIIHSSLRNMAAYTAVNEPMLDFGPGSQERKDLENTLKKYIGQTIDVPIVIGDEEIRTKDVRKQLAPHDHRWAVATFYHASSEIIKKAIESNLKAREDWEKRPLKERCDIFLRAADLISKKYRMDLIATTMIGQAKNVWQAEIDAAAELIDFLRFDVMFAQKTTEYQPLSPSPNTTVNSLSYRGLEGFWAAVCPFNFTAIGGHLPMAPALMGNVALWKPSDTAVLSNYTVYKIYREAGLPPGVINFLPADGPVFGDTVLSSPDFVGLNFTGSVPTFKKLWKQVAQNLDTYKNFPRIIGECGGKNFHFIHPSADIESVVTGSIRSAFEYNGQKCSALSRMYVPESLWPKIKSRLVEIVKDVKMGSPLARESFVTAVIDDKAFARVKSYIDHAKTSPSLSIIAGGGCDDSIGYFIEPTIIETKDPLDKIMQEEIFGPVVTAYVYPDNKLGETIKLAQTSSPYALTGAIYVQDKAAKAELTEAFRYCAGNFYINDKSTGSIVGQQPFGGARMSGTNDKAGGPHYMARFTSPVSIKETFVPQLAWRYPSMEK
ncbi:delta-1-pyrroline-5-carboxylate dehydrogenase, mitochondrial-like [Physella acuta]|uniref:delta-1-pyrroline-5-carboxylate dehydrogenase, mitochondrial-like n=1 Tax=Physella acuta TaxID=109671 RepID=UPI0027DBE627|nr:delta-1-pyrroline-5-carboxylate dehydrogenase, mitochondrial-like [Physella acuta]